MRTKLKIAAVVGCAVLLLSAGVAYAVDSLTRGTISDGVTIAGVDVGGMDADQAAYAVRQELVKPLQDPVKARFEKTKFKLSAEKLDVRADVDGMVDEALEASETGGVPGRLFRKVTGGEVDRDIEPRVAYSKSAVKDFAAKVGEAVDREPRDASVEPSPNSIEPVPSAEGVTVRQDDLIAAIGEQVQRPAELRDVVDVDVDRVEPEITTEELAASTPHYITVDRSSFQLRYYRNLKLEKTYSVAVGALGFDTPAGLYHIQSKQVDPVWTVPDKEWAGDLAGTTVPGGVPENPLKARWMGIYDGAGIHGTSDTGSLGSAASHGCVRMAIPDVIDLYDRVPTGTPIYIG